MVKIKKRGRIDYNADYQMGSPVHASKIKRGDKLNMKKK